MTNIILNTDSYKASHFLQYPPNTSNVSSYIEARGGKYEHSVFFGMQAFIKEYLCNPVTREDVNEASDIFELHGVPFNRDGWLHIVNKHGGYLPLEIQAVEEGTILPVKNVLVQVRNTDEECFWLTSYIETALLRAIWYPTTVATLSWHIKGTIKQYLKGTADNLDALPFKLHDFGARGVSSEESAMLGGMAHLINFYGSDTLSAIVGARQIYGADMAGFSIPASEHSTMTSWGRENEQDAYSNMLGQFGGDNKIVAVVSDSYDLWNAVDNIWGGSLKGQVENMGGTLVIRPDSGEPVFIVTTLIEKLMLKFGYTTNSKGYRVLPKYIRVIQGDGVCSEKILDILSAMGSMGQSADNITFGMGGELLQKVHRDTMCFAMKASAALIGGEWRDVYKDPATDSKKRSKRGRLALICDKGTYSTIREDELGNLTNLLKIVYLDGRSRNEISFDKIRMNANCLFR